MTEQEIIQKFDEQFGETFQTCGAQIKKRCPECQCKALSCNISLGIYRCFQCNYSGKLDIKVKVKKEAIKKKFSQKLQLQLLDRILENSILKDSHRRYLKKSGVLYPDQWNLKSVPLNPREICKDFSSKDLLKSGLFKETGSGIVPIPTLSSDNIIIPYYDYEGNLVAAKTRNVILGTLSKYKYMAFPESPTSSFVYSCLIPGKKDLIITEGEKKAIIANSFGFSTCAFGGLGFGKDAVKRLKSIVIKEKISRLFIILDKDDDFDNKLSAKLQACKLFNEFSNKACIVFLDQMNPDKVGLDDYLLSYGSDELQWILEETWKERKQEFERWQKSTQLTSGRVM